MNSGDLLEKHAETRLDIVEIRLNTSWDSSEVYERTVACLSHEEAVLLTNMPNWHYKDWKTWPNTTYTKVQVHFQLGC